MPTVVLLILLSCACLTLWRNPLLR